MPLSTRTKLKNLGSKKRQTIRLIYTTEQSNDKIEVTKVLNIYRLNICQVLTLVFKRKQDTAPAAFRNNRSAFQGYLAHSLAPASKFLVFFLKKNLFLKNFLYFLQKKFVLYFGKWNYPALKLKQFSYFL